MTVNQFVKLKIKTAFRAAKVKFSGHAQKRMGERRIKISAVEAILDDCEIAEEQYHGFDLKFIIHERQCSEVSIYVVVACPEQVDEIVIVTVCRTMDEVWQDLGGILHRK